MKVLFLTNIPSPYRVDFFNELGKLCDLTVLYELGHASDRDEAWKANNANTFKEILLSGKKVGADSAICFSVIRYLKDKSYDIIVIGGYSTPTGMLAIEYLKRRNIEFILNCDGGIIKQDNKIKYSIKKYFIRSAKAWLSTGKNTNDYMIHYGAREKDIYIYPFTSVNKKDILNNTIDEKIKSEHKKKLNIREEKVILSVGQFIHRKGFDILIEATKLLPKNYGIYIIGGEVTEEYISLKNNYNLDNVHFEGFKNKGELETYYKAADLFVLPTREDIWGLVINEAMSYGLPVITTDKCVAGLELIDNDENGFIVSAEDEKLLADKINEILYNNITKESMGIKNLKKIREYTIEEMAKVHKSIFEEILKEKYGV